MPVFLQKRLLDATNIIDAVSVKLMRIAVAAAAALAFSAGAGIVWLFPYRLAIDDLDRLRQQELSLKQAYLRRQPDAPKLDLLQIHMRHAQRKLALLRQQLTGSGEQEAVMDEIDTAGRTRGLRFTMFKPDPAGKISIQISAVGSYRAVARFIDDIARLPRIVMLDPLTLQAADGLLNLQATVVAIPLNSPNGNPHETNR
ncbi:hypothetical protein D9O50_12585 [Oxalobacteraceae bacterium CAVE-383]|nr:hypothetical protein D9O50_12585 [Oxalobacteraceae bacterium CAVE-383]